MTLPVSSPMDCGESGVSSTSIGRTPPLAERIQTGIDQQPVQPRVEPIRIAQPGRSRHALMNVSWTASRASSWSRRISRATASSLGIDAFTRTANAS
jgi:hypothetical protein